jgi:hypothetical protein
VEADRRRSRSAELKPAILPHGTEGYSANCGCYQSSFNPNWICRDAVDVLVITPAVGETPVGVKVMAFGVLKLARFRRLNNSARN